MKYFAIKNFKANEVYEFSDPVAENASAKAKEPNLPDKAARQAWLGDPSTDSCCFSVWEGFIANLRIKSANPACRLHGLVADYDATNPGSLADIAENIKKLLEKNPGLVPQYAVLTPSNHYRLVWEFSEPLNLQNSLDAFIPGFLDALKKLLRLDYLLAGLDAAAYSKPSQYYHIAGTWHRINPDALDVSEVQGALVTAVSRISKFAVGGQRLPEIPMEEVYKEAEKRFPGRLKNVDFKDGAMGPAFWDDDAKNPRSTIYKPCGAVCFSSDDKVFKPWSDIFGPDFVRKWQTNRIGSACEGIYYLPKAGYFRKWEDGQWRVQPKEDLALFLTESKGLSRAKGTANAPSEVEKSLLFIQQSQIIDGAAPFVFDKREIVIYNNQRMLNTSRAKPMQPDRSISNRKWGEGFPTLAKWLWQLFRTKKQLVYMLAWLQHAYVGALTGVVRPGLALFLVGAANTGKSLLNQFILPLVMGGGFNAKDFLVHGRGFNKGLAEAGHWWIDDSEAASDQIQHTRFSERLKALVANSSFVYEAKFQDSQMLPFNARIVITLNEDGQSIRMIPDLDLNIVDKVMILSCPKTNWVWAARASIEKVFLAELPAFLGWLETHEFPEKVRGTHLRFGTKSFIDHEVRLNSAVNSYDSDILDVAAQLFEADDAWYQLKQQGQPWVGTAAQFMQAAASNSVCSKMLNGMTVRSIGIRLSKLSKVPGSGVIVVPSGTLHRQALCYKVEPR